MSVMQLVGLAINVSIFALVLTIGLEATIEDATYLLRRPGLLLRSLLSLNVIMVLVAAGIIAVLQPAPEVAMALGAVALSPVPPFMPTKQKKAGGTHAYAIGLLCAAALASIVLVPLGLSVLGALFDIKLQLSPGDEAGIIMLSVLVPLAVGMTIRRVSPAIARRLVRPLFLLAIALLVLALLPVLVFEAPVILKLLGDGLLLGLVAFALIGLAVGHFLGGPEPADRTVLALATSTRHPGVAIAIASLNYPDLRAVLAVILSHLIVSGIIAAPYVRWRQRETHGAGLAVK